MNENRVIGKDRIFMFSFDKDSTALIFQSYNNGKIIRNGIQILSGDAKESFPDIASKFINIFPSE